MHSYIVDPICANLAPHVFTTALPAAVLLGIVLHSRVRVQGLSTWCGVYYVVAALLAGAANAAAVCAMVVVCYRPTYIFNGIVQYLITPLLLRTVGPSILYVAAGIVASTVVHCFVGALAVTVIARIGEKTALRSVE
ncbi:hypothetical protein psal_cds_763 [Pandoravirus salinus]|uniref:Transmembrane protein n=1 Tax=Pandoravirus salinus TaxID=1349410 RepID=S4VVT1_9VIRU|nr:hypothetical protein psal_cds_763 [Pandoravirus salinus]AGO84759.1 hypothetical protein psal_cds_763 [Pandoravirus salinus]